MSQGLLDTIGHTPLVQLRRVAADLPVPVWVKCEHMNPGGSVKDRISLAIVDDAASRGLLKPGDTLIEATAGNTGLGLALVAAARGLSLVCVMPAKMSADKQVALEAVGATVIRVPNAPLSSPDNFRHVARRMAAERGWFLTDQFENPANPAIHETTTGPEILCALPDLAAFVASSGTGGTITGVGRYLRRAAPGVQVVLADPLGSGMAEWVRTGTPGPDGAYTLEGVGSAEPPPVMDRAVIDAAETVSDAEAYAMTRRLIREEGLFVGGSSGLAVAAALRVAARVSGPVVALLPDSWDRYLTRDWMRAGV